VSARRNWKTGVITDEFLSRKTPPPGRSPVARDGCPGTFTWSKNTSSRLGVRRSSRSPPPVEAAVDAVAVAPTGSGDALPAPDAAVTVVPWPQPQQARPPLPPRAPMRLRPRQPAAAAADRPGKGKEEPASARSRSRPNGVARLR